MLISVHPAIAPQPTIYVSMQATEMSGKAAKNKVAVAESESDEGLSQEELSEELSVDGEEEEEEFEEGSEAEEADSDAEAGSKDGEDKLSGKKRKRVMATELDPEKLKAFQEAEKKKGVVSASTVGRAGGRALRLRVIRSHCD